jgi:serine/threonine protein kinase
LEYNTCGLFTMVIQANQANLTLTFAQQNVLINRVQAGTSGVGGDFGISSIGAAHQERLQALGIGTAVYIAPEVSQGTGGFAEYSEPVDIYSFGILLWNLWTGEKDPFQHAPGGVFALMLHITSILTKAGGLCSPPATSPVLRRSLLSLRGAGHRTPLTVQVSPKSTRLWQPWLG